MSGNGHADGTGMSIEEYARLPDDGTWTELVRGRLVREPQPNFEHARLQVRLTELLRRHIREAGLELVCVGNLGVILSEEPATVRGPDAAVIRKERLPDPHHAGFLHGAPDLVIEVLSPSNRAADVAEKVSEYLAAGARSVWVVDPRARTVAVHEAVHGATVLGETGALDGGDVVPGLRLPVAALFTE